MITVLRANLVERRRSEAALRKAKEAAEQATNAKSEFLANMSHEIRTPMNGILGLTELLLDTEMSPQQRGYQKLVKHSAESLLSVLNDILDFSKVEAGKLELDCHEFELRDSVADTLHGLGLNIAGRPIELACRIGQDVPNQLIGDLGRFRQILINLVGNALKFTQEGEVLLEISLGEIKGEEISLVVTVSDSGIGIPAEKKQSIFESFTQADSATTRNFGGTGLGLTISAQLVKLMHGRIWVESEPGVGSKFHFTARFTLPRGLTDSPDPLPTHLSDLQVIVADDHATSRQILAEMLAQWGISPAIASSGREALELLDAADTKTASSNRLLILDRSMPEIDGEAVARQIKSRQIPNPPKILLLSPAGRLMDEAEMAELGISRVLAKPLKASSLRRAIEHCLDRGTSSGEEHENARSLPSLAERQTVAPRAHGLKLLLAEDGRVNQVVATQILKEGGHQVTLATNGREVLDALKRDRFDAIIMDVQMPEIDGYQATEQIRANERESGTHIPIIAMTANAMAEDREKCLASGMDAYVAKPVQRDELFSALEQAIVN
jgi:CheY-like chemotaxis protein/nitrogen-specific signal transduction histidine kinase